MPRRAAALTSSLRNTCSYMKHTLRVPHRAAREISGRGLLEHGQVSANRIWIGQVTGRRSRKKIGLGKIRSTGPRMSEAPAVGLFGHAQRRRIDRVSQTYDSVVPKLLTIRCEISLNHDTNLFELGRVSIN